MSKIMFWACVLAVAGIASGQEIPEQFQVWGKQAAPNKFLGDPGLDTPGATAPEASAAEKAAGFFIFTKPVSAVVTPDYTPIQADRCAALAGTDCPGQYGPVTFFVYALKKDDFSVRASALAGPGGKKIPGANLDVRAVRCAKIATKAGDKDVSGVTPLLLEAFDKKTVQANRFQQFWITYYIPTDAQAGLYQGSITVTAGGKDTVVPLKLEVYGFKLPPSPVNFFIYHQRMGSLPKELLAKQFADLHCHGMTMDTLAGFVKNNGDLNESAVVEMLETYKQSGLGPYAEVDFYNRIICEWLQTPDKTTEPPMYAPWFRYYPFTEN